jgi:hypothetical protein
MGSQGVEDGMEDLLEIIGFIEDFADFTENLQRISFFHDAHPMDMS